MSPKEKSKELITSMFQPIFDIDSGVHTAHDKGRYIAAIKCAIKSVEEAEKSEYNVLVKFGFVTENYKSDYWQQVKNELLKQQNNG